MRNAGVYIAFIVWLAMTVLFGLVVAYQAGFTP